MIGEVWHVAEYKTNLLNHEINKTDNWTRKSTQTGQTNFKVNGKLIIL